MPDTSTQNGLIPLSRVKRTPTRWMLDGLFQRERLNLIEGRPGDGKSSFCGLLAALHSIYGSSANFKIPLSWPKINREPNKTVRKSGVLWLTQEEPESQILDRAHRYGSDLDQIFILGSADGGMARVSLPHHFDFLRDLVNRSNIGLLVVDPIQMLCSGNVNLEAEVREALEPLLSWAPSAGLTLIATRHFRKNLSGVPRINYGTNSNAFSSLARSLVHVEPMPIARKNGAKKKQEPTSDRDIVLRVVKLSNGAPDSTYKMFMSAGLITSIEEYELDSAIASESDEEETRTAIGDAMTILQQCKDKFVRFSVLEEEAKRAGVGLRTLQKAKYRLGYQSRRVEVNGTAHWEWGAPSVTDHIPGPWDDSVNDNKGGEK